MRSDPVHWYATLLSGPHRLVIRGAPQDPDRMESNTLRFIVERQAAIVVDVSYTHQGIHVSLAEQPMENDQHRLPEG